MIGGVSLSMDQLRHFRDLYSAVQLAPKKTIAVAAAQDPDVLSAVSEACHIANASAILCGDRAKILSCAQACGADLSSCTIEEAPTPAEAAYSAVRLIQDGKADIIMKGMLDSSTFLKAIFARDSGIRIPGRVLSSIAVMDFAEQNRLLLITDPGFVPYPDLEAKRQMLLNAVDVAQRLGISVPKVAVLSASETLNPKIVSSAEARLLQEMGERGELGTCQVAGPISLDLAISEISAHHKKYQHPVAGHADILLTPNVESGNILYKSLTYFSHMETGGVVAGSAVPVVFTSRSDSPATKRNTILLAITLSQRSAS